MARAQLAQHDQHIQAAKAKFPDLFPDEPKQPGPQIEPDASSDASGHTGQPRLEPKM